MRKLATFILFVIALGFTHLSSAAYERYPYSWGREAKNGLQLGIALSQKEFAPGEKMVVHLALKNNSKVKVITPFPRGWPWLGIQFAVKGGHRTITGSNVGNDYPVRYGRNVRNTLEDNIEYELIVLAPGEMIQGDVKITDGLKGLRSIQALEPGQYRIMANFSYTYMEGFMFPASYAGATGDSGTVSFAVKLP